MTMYAALLRAVNVGGRKVPMKDLKALFEDQGHDEVVTYIQSGNVVFDGTREGGDARAGAVRRDRAGLRAEDPGRAPHQGPAREGARHATRTPAPGVEGNKLHVVFLEDKPTAKAIGTLDPDRSPPDEFTVIGREIFILAPNGVGRSKLTIDWFEKRLGTVGTNRNWNTVNKLLSLMVK